MDKKHGQCGESYCRSDPSQEYSWNKNDGSYLNVSAHTAGADGTRQASDRVCVMACDVILRRRANSCGDFYNTNDAKQYRHRTN